MIRVMRNTWKYYILVSAVAFLTLATGASASSTREMCERAVPIEGNDNRLGQLLATDDNAGEDMNFRIVQTLSPGRYFLRVESADSSNGSFELTLDVLSW